LLEEGKAVGAVDCDLDLTERNSDCVEVGTLHRRAPGFFPGFSTRK